MTLERTEVEHLTQRLLDDAWENGIPAYSERESAEEIARQMVESKRRQNAAAGNEEISRMEGEGPAGGKPVSIKERTNGHIKGPDIFAKFARTSTLSEGFLRVVYSHTNPIARRLGIPSGIYAQMERGNERVGRGR